MRIRIRNTDIHTVHTYAQLVRYILGPNLDLTGSVTKRSGSTTLNIGILTKPFGREPVKRVSRKGGWGGDAWNVWKKEEVDQKGKYC
jgi:hypothetical protein